MNKPFDLEKALAGEPVITRDGIPVKIAGINESADEDHTIVGWCCGFVRGWSKDGTYDSVTHSLDLFMAEKPKVKKTGWLNIYKSGTVALDKYNAGCIYDTQELANKNSVNDRITCVQIEWEEEV